MYNPSAVRISRMLVAAIKCHPSKHQYEIAIEANLHPSTLTRMIRGYERLEPNDARVLRIGQVLGLKPKDLFEKSRKNGRKKLTTLDGGGQ